MSATSSKTWRLRFPNTIFMEIMGLPTEDAKRFQLRETQILHGGDGDP